MCDMTISGGGAMAQAMAPLQSSTVTGGGAANDLVAQLRAIAAQVAQVAAALQALMGAGTVQLNDAQTGATTCQPTAQYDFVGADPNLVVPIAAGERRRSRSPDEELLRRAEAKAREVPLGAQTLDALAKTGTRIEIVSDAEFNRRFVANGIGRFESDGVDKVIYLNREHMLKGDDWAGALLVHEAAHALGGNEDAAEEYERVMKESLGIPYVRD